MPVTLEPVEHEALADDPSGQLMEVAVAQLPPLGRLPALRELEEVSVHDTPFVKDPNFEEKHPRWPAGTPGGLGGKFMRVGQVFEHGGQLWEVDHVYAHKVVAHEASGNIHKVEERVFDTTKTPGAANELGGATRPSAKAVLGGKSGSNVTVVEPYVDPKTHNPALKLPENSHLTAEEWQQFGELEQLHYIDLQRRFGKHTAGGASNLIKQAYNEAEAGIADYVSGAYSSQYGSSSGWTLSLTNVFHAIKNAAAGGKQLEQKREKREKARELQAKIRDAYAWDLYNRTHSPDVTMVHKDRHNHGTHWWKSNFIDGNKPIFSGLSHSHHFRSNFWSQQTGVAHAVSARHIVMLTWVAGPMKGATKSFQSEREIAVPYQLKVDGKRTMSFHNSEVPVSMREWLEGQTEHPASGAIYRMFKAAVEEGAYLPTPPPLPKVEMADEGTLPPPQEAANAMAEYHADLPGGGEGNWSGTGADLKKFKLPWANTDAKGVPQALDASDIGYKEGDFLMGLKGTLYWLGPNPTDTTGTGLILHKMVPDGKGGLKFTNEKYPYKTGFPNYKLQGNVPPPKDETVDFDPDAWAQGLGDKVPISKLQKGDYFKVDGNIYEITGAPGAAWTDIRDPSTGLTGKINSDYQTLALVPKEGYVPKGQLQPAKGLTFAYHGKKHTITKVSKDGIVSAKPVTAGSKVVKIPPDDPALVDLFDPAAWEIGKPEPGANFKEGDLFHGGRGKKLRPYKVSGNDGTWIYWDNLDTGETGKFLAKKKLTRLLSTKGESPEPGAEISTPPPPENKALTHDELQFGDLVDLQQLQVGDVVMLGQAKFHLSAAPQGQDGEWMAYGVDADGNLGAEQKIGSDLQTVMLVEKNKPFPTKPTATDGMHHGYSTGQQVEMQKKFGNKTWKGTVVGSTKTPGGKDALEVQGQTKAGPKIYTVALDKVITPPAASELEAPPNLDSVDIAQDTLPELNADTFAAYKSSHGPGGKYKHDRIEAMPQGMVFQDKSGALWKVQVQGSSPIITDGTQNYKVNGKLRGRALPEQEWEADTPPLPAAQDPAVAEKIKQVEIKKVGTLEPPSWPSEEDLGPNAEGITLAQLQPGQFFTNDAGAVMQKTGAVGDTAFKTMAGGEDVHGPPDWKAVKIGRPPQGAPPGESQKPDTGIVPAEVQHPAPPEDEALVGFHDNTGQKTFAQMQVGEQYLASDGESVPYEKLDGQKARNLTTGALAEPHSEFVPAAIKPAEPGAGAELPPAPPNSALVPNEDEKKFYDLPIGSKLEGYNGLIYTKTGQDQVLSDEGQIWHPHSEFIPGEVALPPSAGPTILSDVAKGEGVPGTDATVVAHLEKGYTVLQTPDGIDEVSSGVPITDVQSKYGSPGMPPVENLELLDPVAALGNHDEFEGADGHPFKVIAHTAGTEVVIKDLQSGEVTKIEGSTPQGEVRAIPPKDPQPSVKDEFAETVGIASEGPGKPPGVSEVEKLLVEAPDITSGGTWIDAELDGYSSAWGSGGKYKHPRIQELAPGTKFRDKKKKTLLYLGFAQGAHWGYDPQAGHYFLLDSMARVREVT